METITCPSCGAPDITKLNKLLFECNYCHTKFTAPEGLYILPTDTSDEDLAEFRAALADIAKAGRDLAGSFKAVPLDKHTFAEYQGPPKPKPFPLGEFFGAWVFTIVLGLIADAILNGQGLCVGVSLPLGFIVGIAAANDKRNAK